MRKNIDVREQKSIEELGILAERQLMENRNKVGALKSGHRYFEDKLAEIKRLSLLDESILINEAGNIKSMADATESLVQNPSANTRNTFHFLHIRHISRFFSNSFINSQCESRIAEISILLACCNKFWFSMYIQYSINTCCFLS